MRGKQLSGFTLVELMVALLLSGVTLLVAHRLFTGVVDGASRLVDVRATLDAEVNARRLLARAAGSMDVGRDDQEGFVGTSTRVAFSTWIVTPDSMPIRTRIVLQREGSTLVLTGMLDRAVPVAEGVDAHAIDYLLGFGEREAWVSGWRSTTAGPTALRLRLDRGTRVDTLLLFVGARG